MFDLKVKHLCKESILISIGLCNYNPEGTGRANSPGFITANMQTSPVKFSTDTGHIKHCLSAVTRAFTLRILGAGHHLLWTEHRLLRVVRLDSDSSFKHSHSGERVTAAALSLRKKEEEII